MDPEIQLREEFLDAFCKFFNAFYKANWERRYDQEPTITKEDLLLNLETDNLLAVLRKLDVKE